MSLELHRKQKVSSETALPQRKRLPHAVPSWVAGDAVFFITICCEPKGRNHLCKPELASRLRESIVHRQNLGQWWPHLIVLMPDHIHGLFSFPPPLAMKAVVGAWKRYTARQWGVSWQRDFFDHRLRGDESLTEKAHYIRMNPVRKNLAANPNEWPYVWKSDALAVAAEAKVGPVRRTGRGRPAEARTDASARRPYRACHGAGL